jgi:hypothetical protein
LRRGEFPLKNETNRPGEMRRPLKLPISKIS